MTDRNSAQPGRRAKKNQRDRYWSLMLVGDHGRVIPFKRFKGIAISFVIILIATLLALTVLSFLYWRQANQLALLTNQLIEVQEQADTLRDEKDVLLTRLVIEDKLPEAEKTGPVSPSDAETDDVVAPQKQKEKLVQTVPAEEKAVNASIPATEIPKTTKKAPTKTKLGADIRDFNVTYNHSKSILQARFRIYNANQPKTPLAGRVVVVFKILDDPPMKWITVPTVQISNGLPDSQRGQIFKIRNYRTMTLKAYGLKYPIPYNTAAVFVFSNTGDLILNQEFEFKIKSPPPVKPVPKPEPAPKPEPVTEPETKTESQPSPQADEDDDALREAGKSDATPVETPSPMEIIDSTHYPDPYSKSEPEDEKTIESAPIIPDTEASSEVQPSDVSIEEKPPISSDSQGPDVPKQEEQEKPQSTR
jgi:type II secretory pathway pseudopilin PulG